MQNILKKGSIKTKIKKSPILRVHDIIEPLTDLFAGAANRLIVPNICELIQLLSGILQILKKKDAFFIIIERNLQKTADILIPEDFHTAADCNLRHF